MAGGCFRLVLRRRRRGGCVDFGGVSRVPTPYKNCGGAWRGRAFGCSRFRAGFAGQRLRESLIPALAVAHQERYALLCSCLCSVRCSALLRSACWDRRCLVAVDLVRFAAASGEVGSGGWTVFAFPLNPTGEGCGKLWGGPCSPGGAPGLPLGGALTNRFVSEKPGEFCAVGRVEALALALVKARSGGCCALAQIGGCGELVTPLLFTL